MKKIICALVFISSFSQGANLDLRNGAVLVDTPSVSNQPATKSYVDAITFTDNLAWTNKVSGLIKTNADISASYIGGTNLFFGTNPPVAAVDDVSWRASTDTWNAVTGKAPLSVVNDVTTNAASILTVSGRVSVIEGQTNVWNANVGVTDHTALSNQNGNAQYQHVTTADVARIGHAVQDVETWVNTNVLLVTDAGGSASGAWGTYYRTNMGDRWNWFPASSNINYREGSYTWSSNPPALGIGGDAFVSPGTVMVTYASVTITNTTRNSDGTLIFFGDGSGLIGSSDAVARASAASGISTGAAAYALAAGKASTSITNSLASTQYVTTAVAPLLATNGSASGLSGCPGGAAPTNANNAGFVNGAGYVAASITNGFVTSSVTNGLVSANVTNGLAGTGYVSTAVAPLLATNGDIGGLTGTLPAGVLGTNSDRQVHSLTAAVIAATSTLTVNGSNVVTGTPWTGQGYLTSVPDPVVTNGWPCLPANGTATVSQSAQVYLTNSSAVLVPSYASNTFRNGFSFTLYVTGTNAATWPAAWWDNQWVTSSIPFGLAGITTGTTYTIDAQGSPNKPLQVSGGLGQ